MSLIKKLPGFRSGSRRNMVIAGIGYGFLLIVLYGLLFGDGAPEEAPAIAAVEPTATTAAAPSSTSTPAPEPTLDLVSQAATQAALAPTPTAVPEPTPTPAAMRPEIPQAAIDEAVSFLLEHELVTDAAIAVKGDTINMVLQVNAAMNEETARDRLDSFVRYFASQVAMSHDSLRMPSKDDLGGVWDHYTLHVGAITAPDQFLVRGAKVPRSPKITW